MHAAINTTVVTLQIVTLQAKSFLSWDETSSCCMVLVVLLYPIVGVLYERIVGMLM